jgi:hypothetical protein
MQITISLQKNKCFLYNFLLFSNRLTKHDSIKRLTGNQHNINHFITSF